MPAVRLFGRRTLTGGDDLHPVICATILVRIIQTLFLLLPLLLHLLQSCFESHNKCSNLFQPTTTTTSSTCPSFNYSHYYPLMLLSYLILSFLFCGASVTMECILYRKSSLGTPTEMYLRRSIPKLLEIKLSALGMMNFGILCFGLWTCRYAKLYHACHSDTNDNNGKDDWNANSNNDGVTSNRLLVLVMTLTPSWWACLVILLSSQFCECIVWLFSILRVLNSPKSSSSSQASPILHHLIHNQEDDNDDLVEDAPQNNIILRGGGEEEHHHPLHHHTYYGPVEEMWTRRCHLCCKFSGLLTCFLFGGREINGTEHFLHIARVLADYFEDGGVLDLVPSDIAAGFMVLRNVQKRRQMEAARRLVGRRRGGETELELSNRISGSSDGEGRKKNSRGNPPPLEQMERSMLSPKVYEANTSKLFHTPPSMSSSTPDLPQQYQPPLHHHQPNNNNNNNDSSQSPTSHVMYRLNNQSKSQCPYYDTTSRAILSRNDDYDRDVIAEGSRFVRHALAIYSWKLYVYMHPIIGPLKLLHSSCCCHTHDNKQKKKKFIPATPKQDDGERVCTDETCSLNHNTPTNNSNNTSSILIGDNYLQIHKKSLLLTANLQNSDILYATFQNTIHATPYAILLDHKWNTVVLTIRGSLSLEDCVVDVLLDPEPLDDILGGTDNGKGQYCHGGVVSRVKWIMKDLERHDLLPQLLLDPQSKYKHYQLRIVGHSLGAGCATLLSLMLQHQYPTLRCLCYSPIGGLLSWELATTGCANHVVSFVLDSDLVPRLSLENMEHLRNEILELILRMKVPKLEIGKAFLYSGFYDLDDEDANNDEDEEDRVDDTDALLYPKEWTPTDTSTFGIQLRQFKAIQNQRKLHRTSITSTNTNTNSTNTTNTNTNSATNTNTNSNTPKIPLYPPGKIIHLIKTKEVKHCSKKLRKYMTCGTSNAGSEYTPVWVNNDDFNEIRVSPTMATDHFLDRMCVQLETIARDGFGIDCTLGSNEEERVVGNESDDGGGVSSTSNLV